MNNFWDTKRVNSLIKLIAWLGFILIVYLVMSFGVKDNPQEENNTNNSKPIENTPVNNGLTLDYDNFAYTYNVNINNEKITWDGKVANNYESGYKETSDGTIIKYEIIDGIVSQIKNDERIEIPDFYDGLVREFLDYKLLFALINTQECENNNCQFNYEGYNVILNKVGTTEIIVNIFADAVSYELNFHNLNSEG